MARIRITDRIGRLAVVVAVALAAVAVNPSRAVASDSLVHYRGGAVVTGKPRVYLVFLDNRWGNSSIDARGDLTFANDPNGAAPLIQEFFRGLGTANETWSGALSLYCQNVAIGAQSCGPQDQHVGYPLGGALAGAWYAPGGQDIWIVSIADAVQAAARHFGNTTPESNRNAQYIVLTPHGSDTMGFHENGWCNLHESTDDPQLPSGPRRYPEGDLVFGIQPYVMDTERGCGANTVNSGSAGATDGYTISAATGYASMLTNPYAGSGWTDADGSGVALKCLAQKQSLWLSTGSFAVPRIWANRANSGAGGCVLGWSLIDLPYPGPRSSILSQPDSLVLTATGGYPPYTWSALNLPPGMSINPGTGLISGTPWSWGSTSTSVIVSDSAGFTTGTTFTWDVAPALTVVPNLRGYDLWTAGDILAAAGLTGGRLIGIDDPYCDSIGLVTGESPEPGTTVYVGTAIDLYVGQQPPNPCF